MDDECRVAAVVRQPRSAAIAGLVLLGYLTGVLLLLTPPPPRSAQLLFPLWVMAVSVQVLWREHVHQKPAPPLTHGGP